MATRTPAPAATNAAAVEILNVPGSVASGAAGVHQQVIGARSVRKNLRGVAAHGAGEADEFFDRLAFGAQRGEQRDNRVFLGAAGENFLHRGFGFLPREIALRLPLFE